LIKNNDSVVFLESELHSYIYLDHASWNRAGYRSAFPFEGEFKDASPFIHSKQDVIDNVDFHHMAEFVKLAISFSVELGNA
jgi:leucyl aminopeptidase